MRTILWGLGKDFVENRKTIMERYEIVGAIDGDKDRVAQFDFIALELDDLLCRDYDRILISTRSGFLEIYKQLNKMGIKDEKILSISSEIYEVQTISSWKKNGSPVPPPEYYKHAFLRETAIENKCNVLVETGTYLGGMIEAQLNIFEDISSIELSETLYSDAKKKFDGISKIRLYNGDSGELLRNMISDCKVPKPKRIFWLDGHYSGGITARGVEDTPIIKEIGQIASNCDSGVILVDDARCFRGESCSDDSYPTIKELEKECSSQLDVHTWDVRNDIIKCIFGAE